uniref:Proteasome subunit alpha type n=1 Tax=Nannospalax galili TaxID=1026970 RepID=A0A8C6RE48_NANGA
MSSINTGNDPSASTFSPDGRVFQVDYAMKAVENGSTAIGIRCKNGVVFGVEKFVLSKLYKEVAGLLADACSLTDIAREDASNFRSNLDRVAIYVHAYTLYSAVRPFGCSFFKKYFIYISILCSYSANVGAQLCMIDPSGVLYGYWGCATGKARQAAKTEIENVVKEVAKIIYIVCDEVKDKAFELELGWVGELIKGRHEIVPKDIREEAEECAKGSLKEEDESDDDNT